MGAFVASWRTCFRVNFIFINPTGWPHLRGRFGVHPTPVSEFHRIFTILYRSFYDLLQGCARTCQAKVWESVWHPGGPTSTCHGSCELASRHSWSEEWPGGSRHVLFLGVFLFLLIRQSSHTSGDGLACILDPYLNFTEFCDFIALVL